VSLFNSRFRGLFIAIVVLALSASAVFAAKAVPQLASFVSGSVATTQTGSEVDADEDGDSQGADADEDVDTDENADEDGGTDEDAADAASDNHGNVVSQAAHMETPDGFRNHGAFVSCVARMKDVTADDLAGLTQESCDALADEDTETDATDEDATDEDATAEDATEASDNHGAVVSQAAQMTTPDGFRNHGAFVSCVARMKDVTADDLATITADSCSGTTDATDDTTSTDADAPKTHGPKADHGHGKGHGKSKHHG